VGEKNKIARWVGTVRRKGKSQFSAQEGGVAFLNEKRTKKRSAWEGKARGGGNEKLERLQKWCRLIEIGRKKAERSSLT